MPFSIGWAELLIVGVIALIVIGPKDLPVVFRNVGQWVGKMRAMAREFQFAMNEAAEQSGINEAKEQFQKATSLEGTGLDQLRDTVKDYENELNKMNPLAEIGEADKKPKKAPRKKTTAKKVTAKKAPAKKTTKKAKSKT